MRTSDNPNLIMQVIKLALVAIAFISQITVFASYAPVLVEEPKLSSEYGKVFTKEEIYPIVLESAQKYSVSHERMMYTIEAESHFKNIQSLCHRNEHTNCGKEGTREPSFGIAQFHTNTLPKEDALDVYKSIDKMGELFSKGEACRWTEYKKEYGCN